MATTLFAETAVRSEPLPGVSPRTRRMDAPKRETTGVMYLEHHEGPRGGSWQVRDARNEAVCSLARRATGAHRVVVRTPSNVEQESLGECVISLVEHFTIWRGGHPCACVYRPSGSAHRRRWFVEVGDSDGWVVLTDHEGLRVLSGGLEIAQLGRRDATGMPTRMEFAPGTDVSLVLLLAQLLCTPHEVVA